MKRLFIIITLLFAVATSFGQSKNELLYRAISQQDSVAAAGLLDKQANPNFKKKDGFLKTSMLILAVQKDDLHLVKLLVSHGAEIDWRDTFKSTALMYAANQGNKDIINYLVGHGADVNAKDEQGNSVLSAAVEKGDNQVVQLIKGYINKR